MRTLTATAIAKLDDQFGVELTTVMKLTIGSTTKWYADKAFTFGGNATEGRILEISQLQLVPKGATTTVIGTVTVVLIDTDQAIKTLIENNVFDRAEVVLYQNIDDSLTNAVVLYEGTIASPVTYDEVARTLSVDIIPPINETLICFAPSEEGTSNADLNTHEDFYGQAYPTGFGRVYDSPCQLVSKPDFVKLRTSIDESNNITFWTETEPTNESNPLYSSTARDYLIGRELVRGTWGSGSLAKRFTATARNKVIVSTNTIPRPNLANDPDTNRRDVVYINSAYKVVGMWVQIGGAERFCISQIGTKCFFNTIWGTLIPSGRAITARRYSQKTGTRWVHQAGSAMTLAPADGGQKHVYIITDAPVATNGIKQIRAWRSIPVIGGPQTGETVRELVRVPENYYSIGYTNDRYKHDLPGKTNNRPITLTFDLALRYRLQGWEDEVVFASFISNITSTSGKERNTAHQIKYIADIYTGFTVDSSSFYTVATAVDKFPSDFTLVGQADPLTVMADIAMQARIALIVIGRTIKMKYLGVSEPSSGDGDYDINSDFVIDRAQTEVRATELEEIVTVLTGVFRDSYAIGNPTRVTRRTNVDLYGERKEEINFYIYQKKALMEKSLDWWAAQKAYQFRILQLQMVLPGLSFEPWDFPNVATTISSILGLSTTFRGRILSTSFDFLACVNALTIWTPVLEGTDEKSSNGWLAVTAPGSSVLADPLQDIPSSTADDMEAVAVPLDGS